MKIMVIGANGFLGRKIIRKCIDFDTVLAVDISMEQFPYQCPQFKVDITDEITISTLITTHTPDLVILTAAMTNVDACEDFPDKALAINAFGPKYIASATAEVNGRMIYLSTDFIFDGKRGNYRETDIPNPLSVYGQTKYQGEKLVRETGVTALICRTSVLFGCPDANQHDNFFSWAYTQLRHGNPIQIIDGQITTPTLVDDLASFIFGMRFFNRSEILHTTGPEKVSRYVFVKHIVDHFNIPSHLLTKVDHFPQKASRPPNSSLNTSRIQTLNIHQFHNIRSSFQYLQDHYPSYF